MTISPHSPTGFPPPALAPAPAPRPNRGEGPLTPIYRGPGPTHPTDLRALNPSKPGSHPCNSSTTDGATRPRRCGIAVVLRAAARPARGRAATGSARTRWPVSPSRPRILDAADDDPAARRRQLAQASTGSPGASGGSRSSTRFVRRTTCRRPGRRPSCPMPERADASAPRSASSRPPPRQTPGSAARPPGIRRPGTPPGRPSGPRSPSTCMTAPRAGAPARAPPPSAGSSATLDGEVRVLRSRSARASSIDRGVEEVGRDRARPRRASPAAEVRGRGPVRARLLAGHQGLQVVAVPLDRGGRADLDRRVTGEGGAAGRDHMAEEDNSGEAERGGTGPLRCSHAASNQGAGSW